MTIADVLFWGGVGGAVLGGLWYGLKTLSEKGYFRSDSSGKNRYKSASDAGSIARYEVNSDRYKGREDFDRDSGFHSRSTDQKTRAREVPEDPELYSGSGGSGSGGICSDSLRGNPSSIWDELIVNRRNCDEVRRDVESLKRSFDELNQEITRRINRANARLARSKPEDPGNGQENLPIEASGVRLKSDLRKIAQERILAKRGRR